MKRPAPYQGPRCATHNRERRAEVKRNAHDKRLQATYGIDREFFEALLIEQDGACAICQRAKGVRRNLSVDHDHKQAVLDGHDPDLGCPECVRGLLCQGCNKGVLGHLRDDPEALARAITYLSDWPSRRVARAGATGSSRPRKSKPAPSDT